MPEVSDWVKVKDRTAAEGAVFRSPDGGLFMRTGGIALGAEVSYQKQLAEEGYPVPEITEEGRSNDEQYFVEKSFGDMSLHDRALEDTTRTGSVSPETLDAAISVSTKLLTAQINNSEASDTEQQDTWFKKATFIDNVLAENPDFDTERTTRVVQRLLNRLRALPMSDGHLDYGLPNAFENGVIDWQHHARAPIGYDVYPMLEIAAFKGGNRGYEFTQSQRQKYISELDAVTIEQMGDKLSQYMDDFLVVKCFFFAAVMKPNNIDDRDKFHKWQYRRRLLEIGLDAYETGTAINPATFPTIAEFKAD